MGSSARPATAALAPNAQTPHQLDSNVAQSRTTDREQAHSQYRGPAELCQPGNRLHCHRGCFTCGCSQNQGAQLVCQPEPEADGQWIGHHGHGRGCRNIGPPQSAARGGGHELGNRDDKGPERAHGDTALRPHAEISTTGGATTSRPRAEAMGARQVFPGWGANGEDGASMVFCYRAWSESCRACSDTDSREMRHNVPFFTK